MRKREKTITKETITKALERMVENKKVVRKHLRGEVSKEVLNKRGIKLAKPL